MSIDEMRDQINEFCKEDNTCITCPYYNEVSWCESKGVYELTEEEVESIHATLFEDAYKEDTPPTVNDVIHSPKHYCREGAMECIDEMVLIFGVEAVKNFCKCNIWKYRYRSADKNGKEDINKSDEYVRIYERLCTYGQTKEI